MDTSWLDHITIKHDDEASWDRAYETIRRCAEEPCQPRAYFVPERRTAPLRSARPRWERLFGGGG